MHPAATTNRSKPGQGEVEEEPLKPFLAAFLVALPRVAAIVPALVKAGSCLAAKRAARNILERDQGLYTVTDT